MRLVLPVYTHGMLITIVMKNIQQIIFWAECFSHNIRYFQVLIMAVTVWLAHWSRQIAEEQERSYYVIVLAAFAAAALVVSILRAILTLYSMVKVSRGGVDDKLMTALWNGLTSLRENGLEQQKHHSLRRLALVSCKFLNQYQHFAATPPYDVETISFSERHFLKIMLLFFLE